jgi:hypothetical protein
MSPSNHCHTAGPPWRTRPITRFTPESPSSFPLFAHPTAVAAEAPKSRVPPGSPEHPEIQNRRRVSGIASTGPSPTPAQLSVMFPRLLPDGILLESAVGRVQRIPLQVSGWSGRHPRGPVRDQEDASCEAARSDSTHSSTSMGTPALQSATHRRSRRSFAAPALPCMRRRSGRSWPALYALRTAVRSLIATSRSAHAARRALQG